MSVGLFELMKQKIYLLLFLAGLSISNIIWAQEDSALTTKIEQAMYPQGMDNHTFGVFYYHGKDVYNNRGFKLFSGDSIVDLKINPSYTSLATIQKSQKGETSVSINDVLNRNRSINRIKFKDAVITAIAYSCDAKQFAVASSQKKITIFNAIENTEITTFTSTIVPIELVYSDNNYYMAVTDNKTIEIWNIDRGTIRQTLNFNDRINDIAFSAESEKFYVLTDAGKLVIYDTKTYNFEKEIGGLEKAVKCCPNTDGKYVFITDCDKQIYALNTYKPKERLFINSENGSISDIRMVYNPLDSLTYIIYTDSNHVVYEGIKGLKPHYKKLLAAKTREMLRQWAKQQPNESDEAYYSRYNEKSRAQKAKELEIDVASRMAYETMGELEPTIGDYNIRNNTLVIHYNNLTDIYLSVKGDELLDFDDPNNLELLDSKYCLNDSDDFELISAKLLNKKNKKNYVFDNLERQSLDSLMTIGDLVPLEVFRISNAEETSLKNIKDEVLQQAKQDQLISDNTRISVKTDAVSDVDAEGKPILNYIVDFSYEVDEEYSNRDDFKPGQYHTDESAAAMLMLKIMKRAFDNEFAKYLIEGKNVKIKVKGAADALPISRKLAYDGKYGEYVGEPVYKGNELNNITLTKKQGMADNEQLAFARAIGVQNYIEKEVSAFEKMKRSYNYQIEVAEKTGGKYRRIGVQYTFIDVNFK